MENTAFASIKAFHYAHHDIPLFSHTRYPLTKFRFLETATREQGLLASSSILPAPLADTSVLQLAHTREYVEAMAQGTLSAARQREMGFPWSETLFQRGRYIVGATLGAVAAALEDGLAFVLGGGAHHSFAEKGRGYCVFNDLAIAALHFLGRPGISKVAILDCDVHQGDGTAAILADVPEVFTTSLHAMSNYPFRKVPSDLDFALPDNTADAEYFEALAKASDIAIGEFKPSLLIYDAGADPYIEDSLGRLALSKEGLGERDRFVVSYCRARGIPVCVVMGGGYCKPIERTIDINLQTIERSMEAFLAVESHRKAGNV